MNFRVNLKLEFINKHIKICNLRLLIKIQHYMLLVCSWWSCFPVHCNARSWQRKLMVPSLTPVLPLHPYTACPALPPSHLSLITLRYEALACVVHPFTHTNLSQHHPTHAILLLLSGRSLNCQPSSSFSKSSFLEAPLRSAEVLVKTAAFAKRSW